MDGMDQTTERPAGWYPDPADGSRYRWWDGSDWTDQTSVPLDAPSPVVEEPTADRPPEAATERVPPPASEHEPVHGSGGAGSARFRNTWLLAAVAAVVLLGAGAAGAVLLLGGKDEPVETAAAEPAEELDKEASGNADPASGSSAPAHTSRDEDAQEVGPKQTPTPTPMQIPAALDGSVRANTWTVVLESLDSEDHTRGEAGMRADEYAAAGVQDVDVIFSSDYASLNPGYWVIVAGSWTSEEEATSYCREVRDVAQSCYQRFVSNGSSSDSTGTSSRSVDAAVAKVRGKGFEPINTNGYDMRSTLQVIVGMAAGSADGYAQQAFFFVHGEYIGTDTLEPSAGISLSWQDDTTVALTYATYDPQDAMCCPTGSATVRYWWNGSKLQPLDPIPPLEMDAYGSRR